jgi:LmbE family N-acetylglucosaminyl deacetylase
MDPLMVVSPHLDDAVLSCGQLMAGRPDCVVATLFTACPEVAQSTPFDASCGFADSTTAMIARMLEDHQACERLSAKPVHLGFLDGQYLGLDPGDVRDVDPLYETLASLWASLEYPDVLAPLGIAHPDHVAVSIACHILCDDVRKRRKEMFAYEELPARVLWPDLAADALAYWRANTKPWEWEPAFIGTGSKVAKAHAVRAYRSQVGNIYGLADGAGRTCLFVPERYYRRTQ